MDRSTFGMLLPHRIRKWSGSCWILKLRLDPDPRHCFIMKSERIWKLWLSDPTCLLMRILDWNHTFHYLSTILFYYNLQLIKMCGRSRYSVLPLDLIVMTQEKFLILQRFFQRRNLLLFKLVLRCLWCGSWLSKRIADFSLQSYWLLLQAKIWNCPPPALAATTPVDGLSDIVENDPAGNLYFHNMLSFHFLSEWR